MALSEAMQWARNSGLSEDDVYGNINNWVAANPNATPEERQLAINSSGVSEEDITAAQAKNSITGGLPVTNTASTTAPLTLTASDGKTYEGDKLLSLARQLAATTSAADLSGSAYGVKNGNIGFDYTEANKLFDNSNATQQVFLDAARGLLDQGVTDLSQLTTKDIKSSGNVFTGEDGKTYVTYTNPNDAENSIQRELTPEELARVKTTDIEAQGESSPATQRKILEDISVGRAIVGPDGKVYSPNDSMSLGSTYTGPGGTSYTLTYDAQGKPKFKTTGFSTSDADALGPLATMASLAFPAIAPWIQAGMAGYNLSQGNTTGALLSGLGAASGFAGNSIANIDALANAGDYAGAVNAWENSPLAQNVGNINLAKTGVAGYDAFKNNNVSGVINAGMSGLNQAGVTLPSGLTTAIQGANLLSALESKNLPAALNVIGDFTGSKDPKLAASALNAWNVISNPNADPVTMMNAAVGFSNVIKNYQPSTTTSGLTGTKVSDAGDVGDADVNSLIGDFSTKFAGIQGNPTTQVAGPLDQMPGEMVVTGKREPTPSWMNLDKGEKIIGKDEEVGTGDKATYMVQIDNPDDPEKPFIYQTYFDPKTGQQMYAPYGTMKTGGENLGEDVLIQSLKYKPTKPIPDWTASDAEKGLPSTIKPTDETFNKIGTEGGLPTTPADLASLTKTDVSGAKTNTTAESTTGGQGGEPSKSTTTGGLGGGDTGVTGKDGAKITGDTGVLGVVTGLPNGPSKDGNLAGLGGDGKSTTATTPNDGNKTSTSTTTGDQNSTSTTTGDQNSTTINNNDGTNTTIVVKDDGEVTTHICEDGYHWDEASQACVLDEKIEDKTVVTTPVVNTPVVNTRLVNTPVTKTPVVRTPTTTGGGGLSSLKLDSSPQFLAGAPMQKKAMELAKVRQLFSSLTPELAMLLAERGFAPPEDSEITRDDPVEAQNTPIFGNLTDEIYKPKFMASGGSVLDSMMPKFSDTPKHIAAAPMTGTGGIENAYKLSALKQLKDSIAKAPRPMGGLAQGGLPEKYAKAAPKGHKPEFITGLTGYYAQGGGTGQSDDIPAMLHDGDYVIDADAVAALGDGSNKAGAESLSQFQNKVPHKMSTGGEAVPAQIADGEYVFPEAFVTALGGGDNKQGAKLLDAMREELREHKRSAPTSKIPPKAKSPLDYLRMAKG